jgi:hypothetical protein
MDQTTRLWTSEVEPEVLHLPYVSYVTDGAVVSGARADAILTVDSAEHGRRRAAGLGAVTGWRMLRTLSSLPVGIAIPVSSLPEAQWLLLQCAGAGIVDVDVESRTVTRRVLPAVVVHAAVARGRSWNAVCDSPANSPVLPNASRGFRPRRDGSVNVCGRRRSMAWVCGSVNETSQSLQRRESSRRLA